MSEFQEIIDLLDKLTVKQAADLAKELEDHWGVEAASGGGMMMMAGPAGDAPAAAEEQTEFDVMLEAAGDKKINVIKEVRAITGLGLKEAKELVEGAPKAVKEGVAKDEGEELVKKLEEAGAKASLK